LSALVRNGQNIAHEPDESREVLRLHAHLMWVNAARTSIKYQFIMHKVHSLPEQWRPVSIAPSDVDLEVCVIDRSDVHALIFPCRKSGTAWVDAVTKNRIDIQPTHWRKWDENRYRA
jgi:hypothetical protein